MLTIRALALPAILLTTLAAGESASPLTFKGKEGLVREYALSYSSTKTEGSGQRRQKEQRAMSMIMVERVLGVTRDAMDMEVDFTRMNTVINGKKITEPALLFLPSISYRMTPLGVFSEEKPVNPFDVAKGSPLPPYKDYKGLVELSPEPVRPGDSWQYETTVLLPFSIVQNVIVTATYEKADSVGGQPCARIRTRYKTQVSGAPSPLGIVVDCSVIRTASSCVSFAGGDILVSSGETSYAVVSTRPARPGEASAPVVFMDLREKFTARLAKTRME